MWWVLIALLRACQQVLTTVIRTVERWPQKHMKNQETQTDVSISPNAMTFPTPPRNPVYKGTPIPPPSKATFTPTAPPAEGKATAKPGKSGGEHPSIPQCPKCTHQMVVKRAHRGGMFFGCPQWPKCNGTRSWREFGNINAEPKNV